MYGDLVETKKVLPKYHLDSSLGEVGSDNRGNTLYTKG